MLWKFPISKASPRCENLAVDMRPMKKPRLDEAFFEALNTCAKEVILLRFETSNRDETRTRRACTTVRPATRNVMAAHS